MFVLEVKVQYTIIFNIILPVGQNVRYEDIILPPGEPLQPITAEVLHSNSQCNGNNGLFQLIGVHPHGGVI